MQSFRACSHYSFDGHHKKWSKLELRVNDILTRGRKHNIKWTVKMNHWYWWRKACHIDHLLENKIREKRSAKTGVGGYKCSTLRDLLGRARQKIERTKQQQVLIWKKTRRKTGNRWVDGRYEQGGMFITKWKQIWLSNHLWDIGQCGIRKLCCWQMFFTTRKRGDEVEVRRAHETSVRFDFKLKVLVLMKMEIVSLTTVHFIPKFWTEHIVIFKAWWTLGHYWESICLL